MDGFAPRTPYRDQTLRETRCFNIRPFGINSVDGVVARKPVQVDAAPVPNRVARDEPARPRVVVAVRQQGQAGFGVGVVAVLCTEAHRIIEKLS